jgi:hypothetical protein
MTGFNNKNILKLFLLSASSFIAWVVVSYQQTTAIDQLLQSDPRSQEYISREISESFLFAVFPKLLISVAIISFMFGCWQLHRWVTANEEPFDFSRFLAKEIFKGFHVYTLYYIFIILSVSGFYWLITYM